MVEIQNSNEFKVGDKVWWFDQTGNLKWGVIHGINTGKDKAPFACIYENGIFSRVTGAKLAECWPSQEACKKAENRRAAAQKAEYKKSIKDLEDLAKFMFKHQVTGIGRDLDAEAAAKERMEELGIQID